MSFAPQINASRTASDYRQTFKLPAATSRASVSSSFSTDCYRLSEHVRPGGFTRNLAWGSAAGASPMFNSLPGAMLSTRHIHE